MDALQPPQTHDVLAALERVDEKAKYFASLARADNTKRAYHSDWSHFRAWCSRRGLSFLPADPETVVRYVTELASVVDDDGEDLFKVSTLERRLTSISQAHKMAGYDSPALTSKEPLHSVWAGICREKGRAVRKVAPALAEDIYEMVRALQREEAAGGQQVLTLRSLRDRALLLVGYAAALRRSEIARLTGRDVSFTADGLRLRLTKSKTDQEGQGVVLGIHYGSRTETCPVRSLRAWMQEASIQTGALFPSIDRHGNIAGSALHPQSIARLIKRIARDAGLNASSYSGHSLRAGFTTEAARQGVPERVIMKHTRHRSERMVREYIRDGQLFDENPTEHIGL